MAIRFDPKSAYKHFDEDHLNEEEIRKAMAEPIWFALVNPNDVSNPPSSNGTFVALVICLRHPGAWKDDLIEVLARPQGKDFLVFHVEHLTDKWFKYWKRWGK